MPVTRLDELQRLLLGEQKKDALEDLGECVRDPAQRTRFISEVLPQALRAAQAQDDRLSGALQEPVTHCIHQSVQRDAKRFADALYPAMGPAIRKSISETLRQFVQSINQALEHSLSVKGLRWRWQAWRSGVSFAEIVLKNTLLYRVEEVYLIHNASGLLVEHVAGPDVAAVKDQDAVSAMLTAIQDFVQDAFSGASEGDLETLEMGERTLWVIRGPQAMMACALWGIPPVGLRDRLRALLEEIHQSHSLALEGFAGDRDSLPGIASLLQQALESQAKEPPGRRRRPWPFIVLLALLAIGAIWAWQHWSQDPLAAARRDFLAALEHEPGLVPLNVSYRQGLLQVTLLRDPLARDPMRLAASVGLPETALGLVHRPYQSLDPDLVLTRAGKLLAPPSGVDMTLDEGVLRISGKADKAWIGRVARGLPLAGVERLDTSGLHEDRDALLRELREALEPPPGVELSLEAHALSLSGQAPWAWWLGLDQALRSIDWLESCDLSRLLIDEYLAAQAASDTLRRVELVFDEAVEMAQESREVLEAATGSILHLASLADTLAIPLSVRITGHSDGIGNRALNYWLRYQRALSVKQHLEQAGVPADWMEVQVHPEFIPATQIDPARRKVVMGVGLPREPQPELRMCR